MSRPQATREVLVDDDRTRISRWRFAPGGEQRVEIEAGAAYRREAGVEHNIVNGGTAPISFVEVELKK